MLKVLGFWGEVWLGIGATRNRCSAASGPEESGDRACKFLRVSSFVEEVGRCRISAFWVSVEFLRLGSTAFFQRGCSFQVM